MQIIVTSDLSTIRAHEKKVGMGGGIYFSFYAGLRVWYFYKKVAQNALL